MTRRHRQDEVGLDIGDMREDVTCEDRGSTREQDGRSRTTPGARDTRVMETRCRCRTTVRVVTLTMELRLLQRDTTGQGRVSGGVLNEAMTLWWLTSRARARGVLNKAMTSLWV